MLFFAQEAGDGFGWWQKAAAAALRLMMLLESDDVADVIQRSSSVSNVR